jgi:hypothetical protein
MQRQVDLTTAVCQERLMATHVRHVLAFVELVSDVIPFDEALDIYVRILQLNPEQARNIGSRALAELGRRTGSAPAQLDASIGVEDADAHEEVATPNIGRSDAMFGRLRRRIRGRVQDDLRQRINLAGARAEDALFETHVENGLIFVRALGDEVAPSEAVEQYLETMAISEGLGDVIYNRSLRILADKKLPPVRGNTTDGATGAAPAAVPG